MHLKSVSIYFIFNVLSALVPILALPFLTRYLTPSDFGLITSFTIVSMFVGNIFRLELNMALKREFVEENDSFSQYISTAFVYSIMMLIPYCLLVLLMIPFVDTIYNIPVSWVLLIILLTFFRFQIINLHHLWQITNKAFPYGLWGLVAIVAVYALTFTLILLNEADWQARAWAEWWVGLISLPIAIYHLRKSYSLRWKFDLNILKKMLSFSLPLLPSTLIAYFLLVSDRIFISEFAGLYELGLYSVALQLAASADLIFKAILPAWESWIFTKFGKINQEAIRIILKRLLMISLLSALALLLLPQILKFLMPYLTDKSFASAEIFLFPCLLLVVSAGFFRLFKSPLIYMRRTTTIAYINISMIVVNIISMYIFVSEWGAIGAAYALAMTFSFGSLLQLYFMVKYRE